MHKLSQATLYYKPKDQAPSLHHLQAAIHLFKKHGHPVSSISLRKYDEHPGEPASTWLIDPDFGSVFVNLNVKIIEGTHLKGKDIELYVELPPDLLAKED